MISIAAVRKLALSFENVSEQPHFDKISFRLRNKIFLTIDSLKNQAVVKLAPESQSLFVSFNSSLIYPANGNWGRMGYTVIELKQVPKQLVEEIIRTGFQTVSSNKKS